GFGICVSRGDGDDTLGPEFSIEKPECPRSAIVNLGMPPNDLLDVLGMDVLARHNNQIFLAADDVNLLRPDEAQIARQVPSVLDSCGSKIGAIVIAIEKRIAMNEYLANRSIRQYLPIGADHSDPIGRQAWP